MKIYLVDEDLSDFDRHHPQMHQILVLDTGKAKRGVLSIYFTECLLLFQERDRLNCRLFIVANSYPYGRRSLKNVFSCDGG